MWKRKHSFLCPQVFRDKIKGCPSRRGWIKATPAWTTRINNLWPNIQPCLCTYSPFHFFTSTNFSVSKIPRQRQMSLCLKTAQCKCDRETKEVLSEAFQLTPDDYLAAYVRRRKESVPVTFHSSSRVSPLLFPTFTRIRISFAPSR